MGRSPCCEKQHTNKGAWTKEEDEVLISYIQAHGEGCWRSLPKAAGLQRCGKSCRLRWINYLRPDVKRGNFSQEEDELIIKLHSIVGNKWSLIASRLPGRTDNEIKNYWNTHVKRKLLKMGVDPYTHLPIMPDHGSLGYSRENHALPKLRCMPSEVLTDFFQQQIPAISSEQKIVSRSNDFADDGDVNLDLSITLPSLRSSQLQGASSSSKELCSGIQQAHKREICCHIGLQTVGGICCSGC